MERTYKLKEMDIKNCTCYYFDDIFRFWVRDIDFSDILLEEKLYKEKKQKKFNSWHFIQNFHCCKTIAY